VINTNEKHALSRSLIWPSTVTTQDRSIPIPGNLDGINPNNFKFILGIFAPAKEFLKITSYYLNSPDVIKITLVFDELGEELIKAVSLSIKDFKKSPIHVSGFCKKNDKFIYELYTIGKRRDANAVLQSLKKIVPRFESVVEEVPLQAVE